MVLSLEDMSVVGALLHIAGSVLIVYGQTIVKVAHCIEESSGLGATWLLPSLYSHPQWRRPDGKWRRLIAGSKAYATVGWTAFGVGNLMRFVSMRFAAQTVLSGLGSLQFVVIPAASRQLLGIRPQLSTAMGVATVLLGNLLIIFYGPPETAFTLDQLRRQWSTPAMRGFLLALGAALASLHLLWRVIHRRRRQVEAEQRAARQRRREASLGGEADPMFWQTPGSKEGDLGDPSTLRMFVAALLFSAVSSFIGAWSVLFSKSLTYVVGAGPASLGDSYSWFTMAAFLGTAVYWIRQSNKGLKLYPASLIMPLMQAFWMAMSVLEGMIYFDEVASLSRPALAALLLGLALAIAGAVAMGLAGFFNEQPQMVALAASPAARSPAAPLDVERQTLLGAAGKGGGGGGGEDLEPRALEAALAEASGRAEGLSSPVFREKALQGIGSLGATLEAELTRVAAWRQTRWGGTGRGWVTPTREEDAAAAEAAEIGGGGGGGGAVPMLNLTPALSLVAEAADIEARYDRDHMRTSSTANSSTAGTGAAGGGGGPL